MTDKQPEALHYADILENTTNFYPESSSMPDLRLAEVAGESAALLRTQHAAIERKDALLRQALETLENDVQLHCYLPSRQHHLQTVEAITKELSQ